MVEQSGSARNFAFPCLSFLNSTIGTMDNVSILGTAGVPFQEGELSTLRHRLSPATATSSAVGGISDPPDSGLPRGQLRLLELGSSGVPKHSSAEAGETKMEKRWLLLGPRLPSPGEPGLRTHCQPCSLDLAENLSSGFLRCWIRPSRKTSCSEPGEKTPRALALRGLRDRPHLRNLLVISRNEVLPPCVRV